MSRFKLWHALVSLVTLITTIVAANSAQAVNLAKYLSGNKPPVVLLPFSADTQLRVIPVQDSACNFRAQTDYYSCRSTAIDGCFSNAGSNEDAVARCENRQNACDACVPALFACGDKVGVSGSSETCTTCRAARDNCFKRWRF